MKMKCYKVKCIDAKLNEYDVGVCSADTESAMKCAVQSILEGKHIEVKAVGVEETDCI